MDVVETRDAERNSMFLFAEITVVQTGKGARAKVRNLSDSGMMAECALSLQRGDVVEIAMRNIDKFEGSVAWAEGGRFGIAFADPIDSTVVRGAAPAPSGAPEDFEPRRPIHKAHVPDARRFRAI